VARVGGDLFDPFEGDAVMLLDSERVASRLQDDKRAQAA